MTSQNSLRRARAVWAALAATAVVAGSFGLAVPAASAATTDDITKNGGAARHDGIDQTEAIQEAIIEGKAKNVILLIGDGMGDSEITVARNYAEGAAGTFKGIDALPLTGQYVHWALDAKGKPSYGSESASTASAWSTGTKTQNGRLSVSYEPTGFTPQATLLEIAKANGLKTGNVTTSEIQDATPGAEIAHISKRGCYGPESATQCPGEMLEDGGLGSISEQLLNVRPDVTLGGGASYFAQKAKAGPWAGETLLAQAEDRGYEYVDTAAELSAVTSADATKPVLGLFHPTNLDTRYAPKVATVGGGLAAPTACTPNPARLATQPTLADMTSKAISLLDNQDGFFLQVEGASIDKRDHAADACGQIGETVDLDEAVQVALAFAEKKEDTLVVVTADHAHTSQIVETAANNPAYTVSLLTEEGQPMIVSYGTSTSGSQQHTGAQVRIAAYGPGAANVVGLSDQTDLFFTAANSLKLERDLAELSSDAKIIAPKEVKPGEEFDVTVEGLDADWQATGVLKSDPVDLGQQDVLNGTATFTVSAPEELGAHTVTITGAQTDFALVADVTVTATPASPSPSPSGSPTAAPAAAISGPLASTGGAAPWALAFLAAGFVAVGTVLVIRYRRRQA